MDLATLKNLKPSEFEQAADGYRATSGMAGAAKDEIDNVIIAAMNKSLHGKALDAAVGELKKLSANFHYTQTECSLAGVALNGFAYDMDSARKKLLSALDDAAAKKFTVNPDGSVTYPAGQPSDGDKEPPKGGSFNGATDPTAQAIERQAANFDPNPHAAEAQAIADRIATALREATEADSKWEPKLRALKADDDLTVSNRDWTDARSDTGGVTKAAEHYLDSIAPPPKDGDPKANSEWWRGLNPEQREAYLALHPKDVGAMNGLPSEVRDEANRTVFDEARAQCQLDLDAIPPEPTNRWKTTYTINGPMQQAHTDEWIAWNDKYGDRKASLERVLKGTKAIQDRFDRTGDKGLPQAYLLGFDPRAEGDGRVIIANGNPDTADHTAVYVPGTGTNIGGTEGSIERTEKMWRQSSKLAPGQSVSTVYWLDYDAPDTIPQAMSASRAEHAGPKLENFLQGTQTAQGGPNASHTTLIGHSYGSTVIGETAKHHHIPADDIVTLGSPGVRVKHASDLGVGADHVWSEGANWSVDDAVVRHGGGLFLGDGRGSNPTDVAFGANVMKEDTGSLTSGHSSYWDENNGEASASLKNQARVIAGRYGDVELE